MFQNIRARSWNDDVRFAVAVVVLVNGCGFGLARFFRGKIRGKVLVFDIDQRDCGLSRILVYRGNRSDRLAHEANFALRQEGHVLDGFTVCPRNIFSGNDGMNAG